MKRAYLPLRAVCLRNSEQYPAISIMAPPPHRFLKDNFHDKLSLQQSIDLYPAASRNFMAVSMEDNRTLLKKGIAKKHLTSALLDQYLFAWVHILPMVESRYIWQGNR